MYKQRINTYYDTKDSFVNFWVGYRKLIKVKYILIFDIYIWFTYTILIYILTFTHMCLMYHISILQKTKTNKNKTELKRTSNWKWTIVTIAESCDWVHNK